MPVTGCGKCAWCLKKVAFGTMATLANIAAGDATIAEKQHAWLELPVSAGSSFARVSPTY